MADTIEIVQGTATVVEVAGPTGPQGPSGSVGATGATGPAGPAGTGIETLTTKGDLLSRDDSAAIRVGIGSTGQILKVSAQGLPTWANESGAVTSVNGQTGAVTVAAVSHAVEHEFDGADPLQAKAALVETDVVALNGVYFWDGTTTSGRPNFFKTGTRKNTKIVYNATTLQWNLVRNTVIEAIGTDGPSTVPWGQETWEEFVTPTTVSVTQLPLETMVQKLAETGSAATATTSEDGLMSSSDKTKLNGIAAGAEVNVNADWNATSGDAQILNKPTLGGAAALNVGTTTGTVAAGDDSRLSDSRTPTTHAHAHAAGVKASYTGIGDTIGSLNSSVTIRADNAGTAGNSIALTFDGVDDIDTVLSAWNAANSSNTATLILGDGSQVPDNGEEITLAGGVAGGSDPFKNINQDLGTLDKPTFDGLAVGSEAGGYVQSGNHRAQFVATGTQTPITIIGGSGSAEMWKDTGPSAAAAFGFAVPGNAAGNNLVFSDFNGGWSAIFEAPKNAPFDIKTGGVKFADATNNTKKVELSAASVGAGQTRVVTFPNKNITLDDAGDARTPSSHTHGNITNDGKVGSDSGRVLVTTTAGAVTTLALGTANQVLRVNSGATGVEFADPSGGGVTSVSSSASDVLGVSGANITGVDANADRIVYWNNTSNKLAYGTPADAGAAAASHTHAASDVTSGTFDNSRINFAAPAAIGGTTPSTGAFTSLSTAPAANTSALTTTGYSLTGSNAQSLVDLAGTWNTTGTPSAFKLNITDTASNASSLLMQLQTGGTNQLTLTKAGLLTINDRIRVGSGSDALPPLSFSGSTGSGFRWTGFLMGIVSGSQVLAINTSVVQMPSTHAFGWTSSGAGTVADTLLYRDAAGTLAQYNGTNAQEKRLYGTYTSSTNYQRMTIKSVKQTLSALSGASATTTGTFIPDGAVVVGVTTRVATALTGAAGYTIGDGTDADRWGDITGTAIGTTSDNRDWTAGTIECFTAGGEITLTAKTSNFTAGGIEICVFYLAGQAD